MTTGPLDFAMGTATEDVVMTGCEGPELEPEEDAWVAPTKMLQTLLPLRGHSQQNPFL